MNSKDDFKQIRHEYGKKELLETDINANPIIQFEDWFNEAVDQKISDANAMTLSTVSSEGRPSARILLLKNYDENGFYFFTNYNSRKSIELEQNPYACMVFFWSDLERQIRIEGKIEKIEPRLSDEYFFERPVGSRVAAAISPQSEEIKNRDYLDKLVNEFKTEHGEKFERPEYWGGYRLIPDSFEFWQGRKNRLNDRIEYRLIEKKWKNRRLAP